MKTVTDEGRIKEIFDRGIVETVLPSREALFARLMSGERLCIYIGADPTSDALHLSHAKNFMFLEDLRALGHEVIVLFGDITATIGDPTGHESTRKQLTDAEVQKHMEGWSAQITPLLHFDDPENPARIVRNSEWFGSMTLKDFFPIASQFTVQQMVKRDMFEERIKKGMDIHLHEFLYPVLQGYDSVALDVDAELCGSDQLFNALAGRTLLKRLKNKDKFVITVNLMANPKTGELMSKSAGTGVFLSSTPADMFGAIMAQPDEMIEPLFINCTRLPLGEKDALLADPRAGKARVAFEIVKKMHGEPAAHEAQEKFETLFSKKEIPEDILELVVAHGATALDIVMASGVTESKSDARRLIEQGAVEIDGVKKTEASEELQLNGGEVVKIGKRHFFKVKNKK